MPVLLIVPERDADLVAAGQVWLEFLQRRIEAVFATVHGEAPSAGRQRLVAGLEYWESFQKPFVAGRVLVRDYQGLVLVGGRGAPDAEFLGSPDLPRMIRVALARNGTVGCVGYALQAVAAARTEGEAVSLLRDRRVVGMPGFIEWWRGLPPWGGGQGGGASRRERVPPGTLGVYRTTEAVARAAGAHYAWALPHSSRAVLDQGLVTTAGVGGVPMLVELMMQWMSSSDNATSMA